MSLKVGFLVNPYAGSGSRTGEKGSDSKRTMNPEVPERISRFFRHAPRSPLYFTPRLNMGENYIKGLGFNFNLLDVGREETSAEDTRKAVRMMVELGVSIITFAGGDGTARDICSELSEIGVDLPILGIPTGVKMHSGVFAQTPEASGRLLSLFVEGRAKEDITDVLDVDEEAYKEGIYKVKSYFKALTIRADTLSVPPKSEVPIEDVEGIAEFVTENIREDAYYVFGTGLTVKKIEKRLGYNDVNYLGVDLFLGKELLKKNVSYFDLLSMVNDRRVFIIVTPIGGQGFIFGRGNQEIGPEIVRRAGKEGIIIVSSRAKLDNIPCLRVDSGDPQVDELFTSFRVLIGYNEFFSMKVCKSITSLE
ncbi:ATP-NAD kinase family protein [Sulfuracidifex tepidarius]|uniref:ATP-NAD kinase n=1 Tax=Sulfuracidifex tepidarius TaxID=1294262 RepID=A0A510DUJ1_9CREN|nr:ATP-NAD kinase family protein [Sulfuracidifex tepidarius]BBG23834.1 hypothetical protein IC006_1129 [Sulfuracidifex tepidarius]BBG26589.1 hypothetical protein IC007_1104 [Sulfuracidifex tepidarius]